MLNLGKIILQLCRIYS